MSPDVAHDARMGALWFAIIVIALIAAFVVSRSRHPKSKCGSCGGTGRKYSGFLSWRWRDCPNCKGGVFDRRA